jgi:hypothetical protein
MNDKIVKLVILADGSTHMEAHDCRLVTVSDAVANALQDGASWHDILMDSELSQQVYSSITFTEEH